MVRTYGLFAFVILTSIGAGTGCSAIQAITNPSASWALGESPTMTVIVRRAELSRRATEHVDRVLAEPVLKSDERISLSESDAELMMREIAADPVYAGPAVRVVSSEAWVDRLDAVCPADGASSLLSMLGVEAERAYAEVATLERQQADRKAQIAGLEAKMEQASEAEQQELEQRIAALNVEIEALEESFEPKAAALRSVVSAKAAAAPDETKKVMAPIVAALVRAVDDAAQTNAAAMVRYPLAVPALTQDVQSAAQRFAADVIEERTGHRPDAGGISPGLSMDGDRVTVTLNGVPSDALGDLSPAELLSETTERTQEYLGVSLGLLAYASETQDRLSFQQELLAAFQDGLGKDVVAAALAPDLTTVEVLTEPSKPSSVDARPQRSARRSPGGLPTEICSDAKAVSVARN